jgi:hypothetical protein
MKFISILVNKDSEQWEHSAKNGHLQNSVAIALIKFLLWNVVKRKHCLRNQE